MTGDESQCACPSAVWVWFDGHGAILATHEDRRNGAIEAERAANSKTPLPIRGHLYARDNG
jgi:hypothetical protein